MGRRTYGMVVISFLVSSVASAGTLRGAIIVAADGTFLGTCDGTMGATSIANSYSLYGNVYGLNSMFNKDGLYGGEYAMYSPFNKYSMYPPYLLSPNAELLAMFTSPSYRASPGIARAIQNSGAARVTVNQSIVGAVDPSVLKYACQSP